MLVLFAGFFVTYQIWFVAKQDVLRIQQEKFDFRVNEIVVSIQTRLKSYEQVLFGVSGLFAASDSVERSEFATYVDKLQLGQNFPGIQGVGYSLLIPAADKARHVERVRREGFSNYSLRPEGQRDIYTSIIYLEPFDWRNQRAFGFDMYSEPMRRAAMRMAWEKGEAVISGKVKLVQEIGKDVQAGFLMYVPVYRNGASVDRVEARLASLVGWVYSPFRVNDLMKGILGKHYGEIEESLDLEIFDGERLDAESLMYDSNDNKHGGIVHGNFEATRKIEFGRHVWTVSVRTLPEFEGQMARDRLRSISYSGITISMLAAAMVWLLLGGRARALALAERMAAKVRESESRSQTTLDNVLDGIITINEQGSVESFNRAAEGIFGYSAAEVIGRNVKMLMPEPYHGEHDGYLLNYRTSGVKKIIGIGREVLGRRKDGSVFPLDLAVNEFYMEGKRFFNGVVRDITERKLAKEKLDELHKELRLLLESTGEGIYGIDVSGCCTFANSAVARMLGYTVDEFFGRNIHNLVHYRYSNGSVYAIEDCPIHEALHSGKPCRIAEEVFWRKDGTPIPVEYAAYPIVDAGNITGAVVTVSDITLRKKAMEEVNRFKNILDNTLDMIFMFDPESLRIVYLNKGMVASLGYDSGELIGRPIWEIKPRMPEAVFRSHIAPLLQGDKPWLNYETIHLCKDGSELPVEVFLQLVKEEGDKSLFVAIARDLTERRKIDKMKSEFISTVSHELRTPLTSIRGSLGLVRGGVAGELPDKAKPMIEIAYNNAERLVRLINDILDMEKIESGKMSFEMKTVELMPLIEHALEANRGYGEQYKVRFALAGGMVDALVDVDVDRLSQVLANLLSNAAKFSPPDDEVTVAVNTIGSMLRVGVSDHGPGIPEEFRGRIFQKFSQADSSDTKLKGGTGLGLSISKAIIEKMGGTVGFNSEAGHGTTFFFELPYSAREKAMKADAASPPRVLVCEDDESFSRQFKVMLERRGYVVDVAGSAEEAKQFLSRQSYIAMTLDIMLPGQDGLALMRELQSDANTASLPIVMVSAHATMERERAEDSLAVLEWLDKPVNPDRLFAVLREQSRLTKRHPIILHIEDEPDICQVLKALIGNKGEVVSANKLSSAKALLDSRHFDLVVLDVGLPDGSGLDILPYLAEHNISVPVMIFSASEIDGGVAKIADAALVKSRTSNQQLLEMIIKLVEKHE